MVKVKICGITSKEDALASAGSGCDGLGFVFHKGSPRYISPEKARGIIRELPARIKKIGVFVNNRESSIRKIARECSLDMLQFSGSQTPEFCRRFKGFKVIKSFRVRGKIRPQEISRYRTFAYLFDGHSAGKFGGTGKSFDWAGLAESLAGIKSGAAIFLAGGLDEKNVSLAAAQVGPDWVDASSRLEVFPGKKDPRKVAAFISRAKNK